MSISDPFTPVDPFDPTTLDEETLQELRAKFSKNLKQRRSELGLTQQKIADALGISVQAVSQWETAKSYIDPTRARMLASYLNTDMSMLLYGRESMDPYYEALGARRVKTLKLSQAHNFFDPSVKHVTAKEEAYPASPTFPSQNLVYCFQIDDDSMMPVFAPGDYVFAEHQREPIFGDFIIIDEFNTRRHFLRKYKAVFDRSKGLTVDEYHALNDAFPVMIPSNANPIIRVGTIVEHRRFFRR